MKGKCVQHGKGTVSQLEELVKVCPLPLKGDLAHAIRMVFECSTHAPKGTASDGFIDVLVVDGNWQRS